MANTIPNVYIQTFEKNVRFLAQQKGSKLRPYVQMRGGDLGEKHNWERVGTIEATTKTGRGVQSPILDTPFSRRVATPVTKHAGDLVEPEDVVQMLVDPASSITTAMGYAMGRAVDDLIIAAATGTALDGQGNANAIPAAQLNPGTLQNTAISLSAVSQVQKLFLSNNIDPEVKKVAVVSPGQMENLLQIDKATSMFFVNQKALAEEGIIKNWMGFDWIVSNRLLQYNSGASTRCLFFSENALGFMMNKDIWTRAEENPDKSFAWQIYSAFTGGAVRVEDEHMVAVDFLNAAV